MKKNPCRPDCPGRSDTCHGNCPKYAAFWDWCEARRRAQGLENDTKDMREGLRKSLVKKAGRIRQNRGKR